MKLEKIYDEGLRLTVKLSKVNCFDGNGLSGCQCQQPNIG
jgi:hypothetical protein